VGGEQEQPTGPDLASGVPLADVPDGGMIAGHAQGKPVLVARRGDELFAIGAQCTHYGGPLGEGLVVGETVRCPWHHACFSLRTGEALKAPALNPVACWKVERRGDRVFVTEEIQAAPPSPRAAAAEAPASVVIVGAGAAGDAAADMLRRMGYQGPITVLGSDPAPPVDRPNLSKDYLAGNAPEEWIPLRPPGFYEERGIALRTGRTVTSIDPAARRVRLDDGPELSYGALLLATGASPIRLPASLDPGSRIRYLRTLADSRAIIAEAEAARNAVVIGASFIGLEVAASLRARGLEVHVVAPEALPLERVMGRELGEMIQLEHERNGVVFHLGRTAAQIASERVTLDDGRQLDADLVVAGIGVRPNVQLAEAAGLATDRGVVVDRWLRTSAPGIYAAGDVARFPDPRSGASIRVEHWVVAQRMGQTAARNILGARDPFDDVPFFWSRHHDVTIDCVGHAERWDDLRVDGDLAAHDASVTFRSQGRVLAVATVGRNRESLEAEAALERQAS
jgi:3-phenylpropionate/trans-cinnamate dioxygenase ferredoxin reductase subunit